MEIEREEHDPRPEGDAPVNLWRRDAVPLAIAPCLIHGYAHLLHEAGLLFRVPCKGRVETMAILVLSLLVDLAPVVGNFGIGEDMAASRGGRIVAAVIVGS